MDLRELSWRERGRLWLRLGIRLVLVAAAVLCLVFVAPPLLSLFMPFVLALVVAWLLHPLLRWLQKRLRLPRGLLSLFLILLVFAAVGGAVGFFLYSAGREVISLKDNWQSIWESGQATLTALGLTLEKWIAYLPDQVEQMLDQGLQSFADWARVALPAALGSMASRAGSFAMSIPSFAVATVVFVMAAYFVTADYPRIRFFITDRLPKGAKDFLGHVKRTVLGAFGGYVRAQLILTAGVFCILLVGFLLVGQSYALLLAVLLAVLDFIPILGSGTAMVPWAVVDLFTGNYVHAVELMAIWGVVSLFRRVGEPKILGSQTGLSPVLSLVSIYVGMRLGGVAGMILGPIVCLVALNLVGTGLFAGTAADLRLAAVDTAAILKNLPPQEEKTDCSKNMHEPFKKG